MIILSIMNNYESNHFSKRQHKSVCKLVRKTSKLLYGSIHPHFLPSISLKLYPNRLKPILAYVLLITFSGFHCFIGPGFELSVSENFIRSTYSIKKNNLLMIFFFYNPQKTLSALHLNIFMIFFFV